MNASETKFQPIVEGTKQYIIPLFQRAYSWKKTNWEVLWDDLIWLCENSEPSSHFIGSIVTMPAHTVPEGVSKFLLIDGQQRLTTIFVLLSAVRDKAIQDSLDQLPEEIEKTMLVNPFQAGIDYFKLLPTQADRTTFQSIINRTAPDSDNRIVECYRFFERKLKSSQVDLRALRTVITNRLSVVSIVLGTDDNPHLVFESLNAKGLPLTQSDLIRNYFFMRIHPDQQDEIFRRLWNPMQESLDESLTEFIRHYLMRSGSFVKQGDVYFVLKERTGQADAVDVLQQLHTFSTYYKKLLNPQLEIDPDISDQLKRLNRIEVTTAYPFLLNCYHDFENGAISNTQFFHILQMLENYLIRRFVCAYPTNQFNKIFPGLYDQARLLNNDLSEGVRQYLQTRGYPKDVEFRSRLGETKLYGSGDRRIKTKLILETLEESYGHKEQADLDPLTIEHVMPQTITDSWKEHLGDDWQEAHELSLHTLGNLTLTAYNPELSNADYPTKKEIFAQSHIELNKYFAEVPSWNQGSIEARATILSDRAFQVWPYFGDDQSVTDAGAENTDTVTGKTPRALTILGQTYLVVSWRDVLEKTVLTILELEPEGFTVLASQFPRFISRSSTNLLRSRELPNGYFLEVNLSAKSVHRFCIQAIDAVGLSREDWLVETNS